MASAQFHSLWRHHPYPDSPCDGDTFRNQCAIRMGVALEKAGVDTSSFDAMYPDRRCYPGFEHSPRHILAAQELANWIKGNTAVFGRAQTHVQATSEDFAERKGIVFIKNGWGATDHIDLWNGSMMRGGFSNYFSLGKEI